MSSPTPNSSRQTLIIVIICLAGLMACVLVFVVAVWVGWRSNAGAPQFPSPPQVVLDETQMPRQVTQPASKPRRVIGVGVMLTRDKQTRKWTISRTFPNSPAAKAGIQNATLLEAVDGHPVQDLRVEEITALLTGSVGSKLTLDLLNNEMTETNRLELIRIEFLNGIAVTNDLR